jgi:uncharacterized protein YwgA
VLILSTPQKHLFLYSGYFSTAKNEMQHKNRTKCDKIIFLADVLNFRSEYEPDLFDFVAVSKNLALHGSAFNVLLQKMMLQRQQSMDW